MRIVRSITTPVAPPHAAGCADVRCGCGSLLARVVGGEVELKCRRCKQVWRLAVPGLEAAASGRGAATGWRLLEGGAR